MLKCRRVADGRRVGIKNRETLPTSYMDGHKCKKKDSNVIKLYLSTDPKFDK